MEADRRESLERWRDLFRFRLRGRWRPVSFVMFALAGALFVTTSVNSKGLDLRAASITDLSSVVRKERAYANGLATRVSALNSEVSGLSRLVNNDQVAELQQQVDAIRGPAGFLPANGPGLTVILTDAPKEAIDEANEPGGVSPDELVVHQQDIQAVVNALWAGGAEAMTIQGQRVISTTGIKCVGNTVVLHGVPYSPPYRIAAIGDPVELQVALNTSNYVAAYRTFVDTYGLGYEVRTSVALQFAPYSGSATLKYATAPSPERPVRD